MITDKTRTKTVEEIDQMAGEVLSISDEKFLTLLKSDYQRAAKFVPELESYLANEINFILSENKENLDFVSPYEKYELIKKLSVSKAEKNKELSGKSKIIIKGLERSAMIATKSAADRAIESFSIIKSRYDLKNKDIIAAKSKKSLFVYDTMRELLATLAYIEAVTVGFTKMSRIKKDALVSVEVIEGIVNTTIELFKEEGIFIPVVMKTLDEQKNPYILIQYAQDLVIIFDVIQERREKTTELDIRRKVADEARHEDLVDRTNKWIMILAEIEAAKEELATPLAKKISSYLEKGLLGSGKLYDTLKQRYDQTTKLQKARIRFIIYRLITTNSTSSKNSNINISAIFVRIYAAYRQNPDVEVPAILSNLQKEQVIVSAENSQISSIVKELLLIVKLLF